MYNIHAILLENDNVLIHASDKTSSELFEECKNIYDFAKINSPKCVIENVTMNSALAVDYYVKQYMSYYGIDHVRGGTYYQPVLSESQIAHLEQELKIETTIQQQNDVEISGHPSSSQMLAKLKYYSYSNHIYEISRATLTELTWLKETIQFSKNVADYIVRQGSVQLTFSDELIDRYEKIMFLCNRLREKVLTLRDYIDCDYPEYLANPRKIFDKYFSSYSSASNDEIIHRYDSAIYMWGRFEFMCYLLINKIDELEFDIANP